MGNENDVSIQQLFIDQERTVNDRELLTFTNLTNLQWEFLDVFNTDDGYILSNDVSTSTNLAQILKDPGRFVRVYDDGREENIYGIDEKGNYNKQHGILELKRNAGIAMEYLEKDEGEFLQNWELVYAADNYKLVKDYIDYLKGLIAPYVDESNTANSTSLAAGQAAATGGIGDKQNTGDSGISSREINFPSREQVKRLQEIQKQIKVGFKLFEGALSIFCNYKSIVDTAPKNMFVELTKEISKEALKEMFQSTNSIPLQILGAVLTNSDDIDPTTILLILKDASSPISKYLQSIYNYNIDETIKKIQEDTMSLDEKVKFKKDVQEAIEKYLNTVDMKIFQHLTLANTGFRVLVFKKGNDIVISYKGQRQEDNKVLPDEFYNLQIVYDLIKAKDFYNENIQITVTGYEGGADLGFLNSLIIDKEDFSTAHFFYNKIEKPGEFLNFTKNHIDKDYKSNIEIIISGTKGYGEEAAVKTFYTVIAASLHGMKVAAGIAGLKIALITLAVWYGIKMVCNFINAARVRRVYEKLSELELISINENDNKTYEYRGIEKQIKGYIEDKFVDQLFITLKIDKVGMVKIKKEDAVYLLSEELDYKIVRESENILSVIDMTGFLDVLQPEKITDIFRNRQMLKLKKNDKDIYEIYEITDYYKLWILKMFFSATFNIVMADIIDRVTLRDKLKEKEIELCLASGNAHTSIMDMMGELQRAYKNRSNRIRFIFYDWRDLVAKDAGQLYRETNVFTLFNKIKEKEKKEVSSGFINGLKSIPESRGIGELLEKASIYLTDLANSKIEVQINEFIFMPYIAEDGNIRGMLRNDYLSSIFKSCLHYYYEKSSSDNAHYFGFRRRFKYTEKDVFNYYENFWGNNIDNMFYKIIKDTNYLVLVQGTHREIKEFTTFYHFKEARNQIEKEKGKFENKFYEITSTEEDEYFFGIFSHFDGLITVNPDSNNKKMMEYKYNPLDCIVGGTLEIEANILPDTVKPVDKDDDKDDEIKDNKDENLDNNQNNNQNNNQGNDKQSDSQDLDDQGLYEPLEYSDLIMIHTNTEVKRFLDELTSGLESQENETLNSSSDENDIKVQDLRELY